MKVIRGLTFAASIALVLGADGPQGTQTIDLGGMSFQAPASWEKVQPRSAMRRAQLVIKPVAPDERPAELVVFVFPGGAGTTKANVERWRNQFKGPDGAPPTVASRTVKGKNVDVERVEVAGTYTDSLNGIGPLSDFHLLGAIVQTPDHGYFLKLVGPEKTVVSIRDDFDKLIATLGTK